MADIQASIDALLTEHLRYTPLSLIDDVINTVNTIVYRALNAVETGLLSTAASTLGFQAGKDGSGAEERKRIEVEDGVHRLETLLEATVDKNFDKLEIYTLRNILTVDAGLLPWVRLEHYKNLNLPLPLSASAPLLMQRLCDEIRASESLSLMLQTDAVANRSLLSDLNAILTLYPSSKVASSTTLSFLESPSSNSPSPLTENAAFIATQLPALRVLLANLRTALPSLDLNPPPRSNPSADIEREARRNYVDTEVQRAVKGAVGVVIDNALAEDRSAIVTEDDVVGLEAAVAAREKRENMH